MQQRTCNIIMCCKGRGLGQNTRSKIVNYITEECGWIEAQMSDEQIRSILLHACIDLYDSVVDPEEFRMFLQDLFLSRGDEFLQHVFTAFALIPVKNDAGTYINGFSEKLLKRSAEVLGY